MGLKKAKTEEPLKKVVEKVPISKKGINIQFSTKRKLMVIDPYQFITDYSKFDSNHTESILMALNEIDIVLEGGISSIAITRLVKADFDRFRMYANAITQLPYEQLLRKYLNLRYWNN